jgi:hypothetical protein
MTEWDFPMVTEVGSLHQLLNHCRREPFPNRLTHIMVTGQGPAQGLFSTQFVNHGSQLVLPYVAYDSDKWRSWSTHD